MTAANEDHGASVLSPSRQDAETRSGSRAVPEGPNAICTIVARSSPASTVRRDRHGGPGARWQCCQTSTSPYTGQNADPVVTVPFARTWIVHRWTTLSPLVTRTPIEAEGVRLAGSRTGDTGGRRVGQPGAAVCRSAVTMSSARITTRPGEKPVAVMFTVAVAGGADDGDRTDDPQLGKLMLYQLSYVREDRPG